MNSSRPKKLPSTENNVKALVEQWFKNLGGFSVAIVAGPRGVHGISDRVGLVPMQITPQMVGKTVGLFVAVEAKKPGRRGERRAGATQSQVDFLDAVITHRGIGALVDCEPDLEAITTALVALKHYGMQTGMESVRLKFARRVAGEDK